MSFVYSRGINKFDNAPTQLTVASFNEFADAVANDKSLTKGQAYICAALSKGVHYERPNDFIGVEHWRLANYGQPRRFLAFDFDGFESPSVFNNTCDFFSQFNCLIYTTASHTEDSPRARALVELTREILPAEGEQLGAAAEKLIESSIGILLINFDSSVYRATQPIYTPLITSKIIRFKGSSLSVDEILKKYSLNVGPTYKNLTPVLDVHSSTPETHENIERLESALSAIPADIDRKTWCNILYSIKAHGFQCGEQRARDWSKTAGNYDKKINPQGYSEKAFDDVWKYSPQSMGTGTLYHHAKQYGWSGYQKELFPLIQKSNDLDTFGDVFNGRFFANEFRGKMIYCYPKSKWLKFNETRWEWCEKGEALQAAKNIASEIAKHAGIVFGKDPANSNSKKLIQHAQNSQNINRLEAMLQTAASEPDMGIGSLGELDKDPMLLGCKNGVIDLKSGARLKPVPSMLITREVSANYDPSAKCPTWLDFLNQCFLGDADTIDYIQKALGYSLTGLVSEEVLHFCFGMGRNGKSVFANVLTKIMGDYAMTAPAEMLMRRDRSSATNDIARLCGARLVLANETRSDQRFDDLTIKTLVSTERISARFLHQEFFQFWPTFKIWIRGNHKPVITDDSNGAWRRIRLIPFENNIPEEMADPNLEEKLLAERDGILLWMVQGASKWHAERLKPSAQIKVASNQYRAECDILGEFISEKCILDPQQKISQPHLWGQWEVWAQQNGCFRGSKKTFTKRLKERGIGADGYIAKERAYTGIAMI
ncbi:hypothetical protein AOC06_05190 [Polynucleobacter paludilacus]|uniref:DNA primase family protein n=1 Tax=Polynucleobacter paludilacus TaxID=1855895 RepID=UPI001BFEB4C3|nr:phage/plasmid primase, P4 family [Polynucleobacter paludilacus]QWD86375.1 hypothetical protein AOC06_05190 [Polynucleobacter paludilacus]